LLSRKVATTDALMAKLTFCGTSPRDVATLMASSFRTAFNRKRCLIPVSGYYEWQDTPKGKQPWYFTARDGSPALTIAGLWDEWRNLVVTVR